MNKTINGDVVKIDLLEIDKHSNFDIVATVKDNAGNISYLTFKPYSKTQNEISRALMDYDNNSRHVKDILGKNVTYTFNTCSINKVLSFKVNGKANNEIVGIFDETGAKIDGQIS